MAEGGDWESELWLNRNDLRRQGVRVWGENAAERRLGFDYSRGDYRSLGYGEPETSLRRNTRYDQGMDEHDSLERGHYQYGRRDLDVRPETPAYRGVGPRGFRRSDERVLEDVSDRFTEHAELDASGIAVSVHGGEVTLRGLVHTRPEKWLAEDLAERVGGVVAVRNELRVEKQGRRRET